jgi:hypothetical protein
MKIAADADAVLVTYAKITGRHDLEDAEGAEHFPLRQRR